jgi:pyridoxal phosphate enzyme (YggS family)
MISFSEFKENLEAVREQVLVSCQKWQRNPSSVTILPVTKNHPVDAVQYASACGFSAIGENRVQESMDKKAQFNGNIRWELIGHLQSNKAKLAVELFDRIQSVDSIKLANKINSHALDLGMIQSVLIQVNAGNDPAKFGISDNDAYRMFEELISLEGINIEGLMTIAPLSEDLEVARRTFCALRELRDKLEDKFSIKLPELSMGMSGDLDEAIREGSTMIRVGTALFGSRI